MATIANPNAKAIPRTSMEVGPVPIPPMTAAPHPNRTSVNVPMNSASGFCMPMSLTDVEGLPLRPIRHAPPFGFPGRCVIMSARRDGRDDRGRMAMARGLDHIVHAVRDLDAAADLY